MRADPRNLSLGLRLTLLVAALLCATLTGVAWLLYHELTHQLWEKDEADIRRTMNLQLAIVRSLDTRAAGSGPDSWQRAWADHVRLGQDAWLRLIAPDGSVSSQSSGFDFPAPAFPAPTVRGALKRYETGHHGSDEHDWVLSAATIETAPGRRWVLQGMFDVSRSQDVLELFRRRLMLVIGAAIGLSAIAGWLLVTRSLAPLRAMSQRIAAIDARQLDGRIADRRWPADLRVLATSFDDMMRRLEAAFEQLSRFSSDLAHEFRSPITNLVAAASVMLSRERTIAEYQDTLGVVVEEGDRLSRMVSSMLFLARADDARQAVHVEPLDAREQLLQLAEAYQASADEHGIRIEVEGDSHVFADAMLLRRALSNLIVNALRHTPSGGTITMATSNSADGAVIRVSDTGSGIAEQHLPHIFERFYRADAARSSSENTGLGLAVVKSIAELHQGEVRVESRPGQGAIFTLVLPHPG